MYTFSSLQEEYKSCERCPALVQERMQVVFGDGNQQAKVLCIGEAPGLTEAKKGIPFCGMSGKILTELFTHIGLTREDVYITNTILCRPPNNRNPEKEEMDNCQERLTALIQLMQPEVIVTIGNFATQRILGKKGITSLRGQVFPLVMAGQRVQVIPVVHPASYLYSGRNLEVLKQMQKDFDAIKHVIEGKQK